MSAAAASLILGRLASVAHILDNPDTQDLCVNGPGPGKVYAWQQGRWHRQDDIQFTLRQIRETTILAGALTNQDVGPADPLVSTRLPVIEHGLRNGKERYQGCLEPATLQGSGAICIRKGGDDVAPWGSFEDRYRIADHAFEAGKQRRKRKDLEEPMDHFRSRRPRPFIQSCVRNRLNILAVGGTGAGKTDFCKMAGTQIPPEDRIITIEDVEELQFPMHENWLQLFYSQGGQTVATGLTQNQLLVASMRMRPSRLIIGELRDGSGLTYARASLAHRGSLTTVHGTDCASGYRQVFALGKTSADGHSLDSDTLKILLESAVDAIVTFREQDHEFWIDEIWFVGDAYDRGTTATQEFLQ